MTTYTAPIVSAGSDQSILVSGGVTLAGSASQADGHTLGLTWTQTAGPAVTLSDPTAAQPTFTAPTDGPVDLSFTLTAVDTQNPDSGSNTASSSVTVHVTNTAPDADSGPNQSVLVNTPVTLDGSGSVDIDPGQTLSYAWLQTSGTAVTLSDPSAVQPTFTAPAATGALTFQLTVDDGHGLTSTSSVEIDVFDTPPVANAGTSQTVLVDTPVALDGSGSFDPDPGQTITYTWLQTSGTPVTLSNAHAVQPTFTAPAADATLTFQLTVDDGFGGTNTATVTVTVGNSNPIAYAGPDQSGRVPGSTVTLDGSGSYDPDPGQTVTYAWSQVSGPTVALSSTTAAKPTFTAPVGPAALVFQLAVDDGFGGTNTDLVTINVTGTPGLDFSGSLTGTVRGDRAFSPFSFKAVNSQTVVETISQADVHVTVTVNGVPVAPGAISITAHSFKATAGKSTVFRFNWNHGATLHAGDIIDVKACIDLVGDSVPANNCGDVLQPSGTTTLTNTVVNSAATITHRAASNRIYATITNTGTAIVTPMKNTDVTITVTVNGGPPQVVNTTARDVTLKPGLTVRLAATWAHAPLHIGDVVVLQSCVNVPGNTGTACSTATYVVT